MLDVMFARWRPIWLAIGLMGGVIGSGDPLPAAEEPWPHALTEFVPLTSEPIFGGQGVSQNPAESPWDARIRERGDLLRISRDEWQLWFTGYDGTKTGLRQVGLATSTDGLRWQRVQPGPLLPGEWVEDVCVRKVMRPVGGGGGGSSVMEERYVMFAEGRRDQMQWFDSNEGRNWTHLGQVEIRKTTGEPIEPGPYGTPTLWTEGDEWHLFYERRDAGIWHATSTDGRIWRHVSDEPVMVPGPQEFDKVMIASNQIFRHGGDYYMVFHGSGDAAAPRRWATGLARSKDLNHWEKYPVGPLRPIDENKSSGIIVHDGLRYRLYTMHDQVVVHVGPCE